MEIIWKGENFTNFVKPKLDNDELTPISTKLLSFKLQHCIQPALPTASMEKPSDHLVNPGTDNDICTQLSYHKLVYNNYNFII